MGLQTLRVFIGNLPLNVTEDDVKDLVQRHAQVTSVELKHKNEGAFAFVDLKDTPSRIDHCFGKLSSKVWKGSQLKIQKAKESFLQRLAKERMGRKSLSKGSDKPEVINVSESQNTIREQNLKSILDSEVSESFEDRHSSRKGHLRMFRGTSVAFSNEIDNSECVAKNSQHLKPKKNTNKVEEEKEILQKFEAFSNVWKDSSDEDKDITCTSRSQKINKSSHLKVDELKVGNKSNDKINVPRIRLQDDVNLQKSHESEKRRLKAIDDRQRELTQRKQVIKLALASNKNQINTKIIFDDTDGTDQSLHNDKVAGNKSMKLKLFDDNEVEDCKDDFRIKNQFEGKKGQSLLKLQSQYGNDKRFKLDERFVSDEEDEKESQSNANELRPDEHQKVLEILGDVLGRDIVNKDKVKNKRSIKPMLRYDPTQPKHVKFKVRNDFKEVKTKPDNCLEDIVEDSNDKLTLQQKKADEIPIVSKEKFYHVSDSLQESLQNKDKPFSLLEMFGDEVEEKEDVPFEVKPLSTKREWSLDAFNLQSSGLDDCTDHDVSGNDITTSDAKAAKIDEHGVMQENLFFVKNDERFKEGLEFIKYINEEYYETFDERRCKFKNIVRKKILSCRKKDKLWKRKIGGNRRNFKKKQGLKV